MSDGDADARAAEAPSGVSRRELLQVAGAVGLATTAGGLAATAGTALFGAQPARAATAQIPFLGSYEGVPGGPNQWFNDIRAVVPGLNGYRQYDPAQNYPTQDPSTGNWVNHFATQWPDDPYTGYAGPSVFSIYVAPTTVTGSQATATAARVKQLMTSARNPHSYLSAWHEYGNIDYSAYGVNASNLYQVHKFLCGIAAQFPYVTYGPILFAPGVHYHDSLVANFQSCPPGMGFYGVDVYGNNGTSLGMQQLDSFINLAKPLDPNDNPQLIVAETNTPLPESFPFSAGTSNGNWFNAPTAGFKNGQPVAVFGAPPPYSPPFGPLPDSIAQGETYYVINVSANSFQLSDTYFGSTAVAVGSPCQGTFWTVPAPRDGGVGTGWYESVCARMASYGPKGLGVLTFWNVDGELSGGWVDPVGSTAAALNNCINNIL